MTESLQYFLKSKDLATFQLGRQQKTLLSEGIWGPKSVCSLCLQLRLHLEGWILVDLGCSSSWLQGKKNLATLPALSSPLLFMGEVMPVATNLPTSLPSSGFPGFSLNSWMLLFLDLTLIQSTMLFFFMMVLPSADNIRSIPSPTVGVV